VIATSAIVHAVHSACQLASVSFPTLYAPAFALFILSLARPAPEAE